MIETVEISGTTYRVYAFRTGKFTWAHDADLGWKNRGFHGYYDISDDRRTVTFNEPPRPKRKEGWKPGDEGCQIEGLSSPTAAATTTRTRPWTRTPPPRRCGCW